MAKFKLEDNVPIPDPWESLRKYPWSDMKVGQSIVRHVGMYLTMRVSAHKASKKYGYKFTTRKKGNFVRIWRIA